MKQPIVIQLDFCKVTRISSQILFTEFYSNDNFDIEEARQLDNARYDLCNGDNFYSLVSLVNVFGHMTKQAQSYLAKDAQCSSLIKYEVILVDSLSIRILTKYYIKWMQPPYKIEVQKSYRNGLNLLSNLDKLY